ncbi:double-stranded RNA-specific editase 1-like isoform X2 [Panulirus ornatus]|uniref:double-stranded RNA-specific editase 1-like isoform X2 n=1 Tax=Panulirus ornatus TaxID=150431 RepID=UPI003A8B34F3
MEVYPAGNGETMWAKQEGKKEQKVGRGVIRGRSESAVAGDHGNTGQAEPSSKKRKIGGHTKNPISILNMLCPDLVYKILPMEGPSHDPVFTASVELKGQMIQGTGKSKKQAKHSAAAAALRTFIQAPDAADSLGINETTVQDFTSDVSDTSFVSEASPAKQTRTSVDTSVAPSTPSETPQASRNPIMILNEFRKGLEYTLKHQSGEPHARTFTYQVTVDGQTFEGTGIFFLLLLLLIALAILEVI